MVAVRRTPCMTRREYLEWEVKQETRHEYLNGVIVAMAGASRQHNRITLDVARSLGNQLEDGLCEVFSSEMRVLVPECDRYYYPDVIVVCGESEFEDDVFDTLVNPTLIIEVLSDSTERSDRRDKFDCYETLPSLRNYVLIAQDEPRIEQFYRQEGGTWQYEVARGLEAELTLPAIGCHLRLADVYARVTFVTAPDIEMQAEANDIQER